MKFTWPQLLPPLRSYRPLPIASTGSLLEFSQPQLPIPIIKLILCSQVNMINEPNQENTKCPYCRMWWLAYANYEEKKESSPFLYVKCAFLNWRVPHLRRVQVTRRWGREKRRVYKRGWRVLGVTWGSGGAMEGLKGKCGEGRREPDRGHFWGYCQAAFIATSSRLMWPC